MITMAEAEKLRSIRADEPVILSLYLPIPLDPAGLRSLPALARDLIEAAGAQAGREARGDADTVQALVADRSQAWLGHTAAIFACGELGLLEAIPLPGEYGPRAVFTRAPYIRPLLAAMQRCPAYMIAIVDRRHAWLLSVAAGQAETILRTEEPPAGVTGFGGWQGRDAYRVQHRTIQRDRHHYQQVADALARQMAGGEFRTVIAGGHAESVSHLVRAMPSQVRAAFAGSFAADLHTLTPAKAQELARPVIDRWTAHRELEISTGIFAETSAEHRAVGLAACLEAVGAGAVSVLLVREGASVPGFLCRRCGALTTARAGCPDWGTAAQPVPDLLELMVGRVLDDGGEFVAVRSAPADVAARLRYPAAR